MRIVCFSCTGVRMTSWHSYPKVWAIGHGYLTELFFDEVTVEEKVDGSQFSFGIFNGQLKMKSKNNEFVGSDTEKMFNLAKTSVEAVLSNLKEGWTYRAEYLSKPKHNVLAYGRVPANNLIIFDINTGEETYLSYEEKAAEAKRLGFECVTLLYSGKVSSAVQLEQLLEKESVLGGVKIEGFVCKNYTRFGKDKKALMGKYVSERFKEAHNTEWKASKQSSGDIIQNLTTMLRTEARWEKAIQSVRDAGELQNEPRDIGPVVNALRKDVGEECGELIKQKLFEWAAHDILRGISRGFAEFYKEKLLKSQFEVKNDTSNQT